jgi:hypothetical protein
MSITYTQAFTIRHDSLTNVVALLPTGFILLHAGWELAQGPGVIEIHYMHTRVQQQTPFPQLSVIRAGTPEGYQKVVFIVRKVGETLPEGYNWCMPTKLDSVHYLFYAIQQ